jgi:hypothetical protein
MDASRPRRQLHGYVSTEAFEAWHSFARKHGVSVTALFEALAEPLRTGTGKSEGELPLLLRSALQDARRVAATRSTRRPEG